MKRDIKDLESGHYNYAINEDQYIYDYIRESQSWGHQHNIGLTYSISKEDNYDFQIKALVNTSDEKLDVKNILVLQNWLERIRKEVTNKVLSIKRISEFLNFPILAQPTLKKI